MSHKAVSWALDQRHLKPAPWIVLIQLADRHNKDTLRCDPDQATLAADCNMSRSTVNRRLAELEELELIKRVPRADPRTGKPLSTFYILGLNFDNPPYVENAVSQNDTRAEAGHSENKTPDRVSKWDTDPCVKNGQSRVSKNAKTVCQNETLTFVREPVREPCAAFAALNSEFVFSDFFDRFAAAFPRMGDAEATEDALRQTLDAGASPLELIAAAKSYADEQAGNEPRFIMFSENWLEKGRWRQHVSKPKAAVDPDQVLAARAQNIRERKPFVCRSITIHAAGECITAGLVSIEDCHAAGIRV